jgi:excisionase family DNA binding protein
MADDDILTVAEVATQFRVTPQTVRSWIDSGKLKGGRVGKAYRILRGDVYAMLETAASERRAGEPEVWAERDSSLGPPGGASELWAGGGSGPVLTPPR